MTWQARTEFSPEGFVRNMPGRVIMADPDQRLLLTFPKLDAAVVESYAGTPSGQLPKIGEGRVGYIDIPEEAARALYEALAERFGGTGHDTRALRRDYDDERKRVDKLTDAVIQLAAQTS